MPGTLLRILGLSLVALLSAAGAARVGLPDDDGALFQSTPNDHAQHKAKGEFLKRWERVTKSRVQQHAHRLLLLLALVALVRPPIAADAATPALNTTPMLLCRFPQYGYNGRIDELYAQEIAPRLGPGEHYLDWTAAGLYWNSQVSWPVALRTP